MNTIRMLIEMPHDHEHPDWRQVYTPVDPVGWTAAIQKALVNEGKIHMSLDNLTGHPDSVAIAFSTTNDSFSHNAHDLLEEGIAFGFVVDRESLREVVRGLTTILGQLDHEAEE